MAARTLNKRLAKAEKKAHDMYFADGVHSCDPTGVESEDSIPNFVKLYEEFFIWKANNVRASSRNGRLDTTFRDTRRIRAQSYIGAQAPLGIQGQELCTEVTEVMQSHRSSMQHLASSSLGPEVPHERSRSPVPPVAGIAPARRPPRTVRSPVNIPLHLDRTHTSESASTGVGGVIATNMKNVHPPANVISTNIENITILRSPRYTTIP